MDLYSVKRASGWIAALRKESNPATQEITGSKDDGHFCKRIGCSGRLKYTQNDFLERSKALNSSSRSSVTHVKKALEESQKKCSKTKTKTKTSTSNPSRFCDKSEIRELDASASSRAKLKSQGSSSNTKTRKVYGQIGLFDSVRRRKMVEKRSTEGETRPSARGKKISGPLPDEEHSASMVSAASEDQFISHFDNHRPGRYNVDSIANVLLALERIDQDEGLTYEQILSLGVNSILGGFNFYDQHRDMRLDIDNMSYEELLALEDKMGTVSTALSEEELSKCLKINIYQPFCMKESRMRGNWCLDGTKCSICQEEFTAGDEIGGLGCDHGYHAVCINQWLRLKNWCPICKASAKSSDSL